MIEGLALVFATFGEDTQRCEGGTGGREGAHDAQARVACLGEVLAGLLGGLVAGRFEIGLLG